MTKQLSAVIIDDEAIAAESLEILLEDFCPEIKVLAKAYSLKEGIQVLRETEPQVVFLDISLASGKTGFDLLQVLPERNFKVVFITAHPDYGIQAIKYKAFDYILKPVDYRELCKCVQDLLKAENTDKQQRNILLPSIDGTHLISPDDILYCKAEGSYTRFYLEGNKSLLFSRSIKHAEKIIYDQRFMRIHRSYIINTNKVSRFQLGEGGHVEIEKETLAVSKSYASELGRYFRKQSFIK